LEPRGNQVEVKFSLAWSGCAGSGCHDNAQDQYLQMPPEAGAAPQKIEYSNLASVRHMNAVFWHSPGHLRSACSECHAKIETSKRAGDPASRMVQRCFNCHAHQPLPKTTEAFNRAGFIEGLAQAGAPPEKRVLGCNACHAFHIHGPSPDVDFPTKALVHPPKPLPGLQLTVYRPAIRTHRDAMPTVSLRRTRLEPWWMGLLAFLVIGFSAVGYVRTLPSAATLHKAKGNVAPQRVPEVPAIGDDYQSNVKRLYIVGEAAGTASINFAMRSGRLVVDAVASAIKYAPKTVDTQIYDVAIVGCGPAGIAATATAKSKGLKYVALEKMTAASTIVSYPRGKFVQATPIDLAEYGSFFLEGDNSKEALLKEWERVIAKAGLEINEREEVSAITPADEIFTIKCASNKMYKARYVIIAIGVRGTPRRLGAPGEAADRVFYNLIEPEEYKNKKILVVGGGNAGAEVTQALANPELGNTVSYSFRDPSLGTVTRENAEKVSALQQTGRVTIYPLSAVKEIKPGKVVLAPVKPNPGAAPPPPGIATIADSVELDNDVIFAMCGAELPTRFLKSIGIRMTKKGR